MIKVFIADDHTIFREGLKTVLSKDNELQFVGEASNGREAVVGVLRSMPDVVLMDISMPYNGLQAASDILKKNPFVKILILTISENEYDLCKAIKVGARGYLLKGAGINEILAAVRSIVAGATVFNHPVAEDFLQDSRNNTSNSDANDNLTQHELGILQLVATGALNKEIAARFQSSENTVKNQVSQILRKLHLKNRSQAAVYAKEKMNITMQFS